MPTIAWIVGGRVCRGGDPAETIEGNTEVRNWRDGVGLIMQLRQEYATLPLPPDEAG